MTPIHGTSRSIQGFMAALLAVALMGCASGTDRARIDTKGANQAISPVSPTKVDDKGKTCRVVEDAVQDNGGGQDRVSVTLCKEPSSSTWTPSMPVR